MSRQRYPNLRRAQRERGLHYRGPRRPQRKRYGFALAVAAASSVMFAAVLWGDRLPGLIVTMVEYQRNLGRDHAPPPGAHYAGCNDARAAGVAPIYADEPGYRPEMDGDGDGIACEPYRGM